MSSIVERRLHLIHLLLLNLVNFLILVVFPYFKVIAYNTMVLCSQVVDQPWSISGCDAHLRVPRGYRGIWESF